MIRVAGVVAMFLVVASLLAPSAPAAGFGGRRGVPEVIITSIPPYGTSEVLEGVVLDADPATHHLGVYLGIRGLGWWIKPVQSSCVPIQLDGSWAATVVTGGSDDQAHFYSVFLLPIDTPCPNLLGVALPQDLHDDALAVARATRSPFALAWAGHVWDRRDTDYLADPGPNIWSKDNVFVDPDEVLHLVVDAGGTSAEIDLLEGLGYGRYRVLAQSRVDQLGDLAILGMYTFDFWGTPPFREIDTECGHFGDPRHDPCQFVVQPFDEPGNLIEFDPLLAEGDTDRTFVMEWRPGVVDFAVYKNHHRAGELPAADEIFSWRSSGPSVPDPGDATFGLNLWAFDPAAIGAGYEVELADFVFEVLPVMELGDEADCPGPMAIELSGLTPGGPVALVGGNELGSLVVPGGSCAGTELGLADGSLIAVLNADAGGGLIVTPNVGAAACGRRLQALDISRCETTNVAAIPGSR